MKRKGIFALVLTVVLIFGMSMVLESAAWARAGGGSSSGSRGSRSFSSPSMPPKTSPSPSPGITPSPGPASPYGSPGMGYSPFWSGMAGGIAGGLLGNMLFGGRAYGGPMGFGGSGIGLFELIIIGALIYFGIKFFRRRRAEQTSYYQETSFGTGAYDSSQQPYMPQTSEVDMGLDAIRRMDPTFNVESFKENAEDMFFRIQAGWMNRSIQGIESMLTPEMTAYFLSEFSKMKQQGRINRLENIAVRKVEPAEAWQESGQDFITVLFTANLLDYTVDDQTGNVLEGDKLNPVKFQEFWTFSRDIGSREWQLSGINQVGEESPR